MPYLVATYALFWIGLLAYGLLLVRRQRQLAREIEALEREWQRPGDRS